MAHAGPGDYPYALTNLPTQSHKKLAMRKSHIYTIKRRRMRRAVFVSLRVVTDVLAFAIVFITMGVLQNIQPYRLGYFASDESITYPYHSSTVPSAVLFSVSAVLIFIAIVIIESVLARDYIRTKKFGVPLVLYAIYDHLIVSFFGYVVTIAITDIGKVAVGRLRPNFVDVCKPVATETTSLGYIFPYSCTSGRVSEYNAILKSFPSGHSSTAMYTAIFLCVYFQLRWPRVGVPAIRVALQTVCVALGGAVCLSRIVDNKHHWTDVLAGATLGTLVAITVPFFIPRVFFPTVLDDAEDQEEGKAINPDAGILLSDRGCIGHLEFGRPVFRSGQLNE